jgi:RsiW-degrading membrane proteinase PrsW (M82 family)
MQGIRPLFRRGRWELPVLMCGVGTALLLTLEHLWFCFLRGHFFFPEELWLHIGTTALLSMMVSPVIFLFVHTLSRLSGYQIRYDGLDLKRAW